MCRSKLSGMTCFQGYFRARPWVTCIQYKSVTRHRFGPQHMHSEATTHYVSGLGTRLGAEPHRSWLLSRTTRLQAKRVAGFTASPSKGSEVMHPSFLRKPPFEMVFRNASAKTISRELLVFCASVWLAWSCLQSSRWQDKCTTCPPLQP